jgi:hypothetical protein
MTTLQNVRIILVVLIDHKVPGFAVVSYPFQVYDHVMFR